MYVVGIDVSKGKSTIAIANIDGSLAEKVFEVKHNKHEINDLILRLNSYGKESLKIVMEATSHYHFPLLFELQEQEFFVSVINALVIKKYCDTDLRRAKNDKKDAVKLAMYGCEKWFKLTKFEPQDSIRNDLLFLSREYCKYVQVQTRLKIQLNDLVDKTFDGLREAVTQKVDVFYF